MTQAATSTASTAGDAHLGASRAWVLPALLGAVAFLIIYHPLGAYLMPLRTANEGDEGLGLLAPILAIALAWERREILRATPIGPDRAGWWLVAAGGLIAIVGSRLTMHFVLAVSLPLVLGGMLWRLCGRRWVAELWFPLFLLIGTNPLPAVLVKAIAFPMQHLVARLAGVALDFLGMPVQREGVTFLFEGHSVQVTEGCSGWRTFSAASWLLLVMLYRQRASSWVHWVSFLALLLPLAMVANLLRIVTVVAGIRHGQPWVAVSPWHEALGLVFFLPLAWLMVGMIPSQPAPGPSTQGPSDARSPSILSLGAFCTRSTWRLAASLWMLGALSAAAAWQARASLTVATLPEAPASLGAWQRCEYRPQGGVSTGGWFARATYRHPDGRMARLTLHSPFSLSEYPYGLLNWMLKHGYEMETQRTTLLDTTRRKVPVCVTRLSNGRETEWVVLTYLSPGKALVDNAKARFWRLGETLLRGAPSPWLLVAVSSPDARAATDLERQCLAVAEGWFGRCSAGSARPPDAPSRSALAPLSR